MTTARSSRFMDTRDRMWAQYADRHRGVCLFFDCEALNSLSSMSFGDGGIALAGDVRYQSESPSQQPDLTRLSIATRRPQWLRSTCEVVTRERSFVKRSDWNQSRNIVWCLYLCQRIAIHTIQSGFAVHGRDLRGQLFPGRFAACIRAVCDREKINAFRLQYIVNPRLELLHPTEQPHPSTIINLVAGK